MIKKEKIKVFQYGLFAVLFCLAVVSTYGQTFKNEDATGISLTQKDLQRSLFTAENLAPQNTRSISESSSIYIQQIGVDNSLLATTRSLASSMNVAQRGTNNEVVMGINAALIDETVVQLGTNNSFIDLNGATSLFHQAAVLQRGTNQNLIWLGSNSLSEKIRVNMSGQKQTVIIRNISRR